MQASRASSLMADLKRIVPDVELAMGPLLKVGGGGGVVGTGKDLQSLRTVQCNPFSSFGASVCWHCYVPEHSVLIDLHVLQQILCQGQAPKLKTDVLEMESVLKQRCDEAAVGDYTLWNTGPEAALDMLRVSESFKGRCVGAILSSLLPWSTGVLLEAAACALLLHTT